MSATKSLPRPSGNILSHTVRFLRDPFSLLLDSMQECGDVFSLKLLRIGEWIFACSPDTINQVYRAPVGTLVTGELMREMTGMMFGQNSLAFLDGESHKARRRVILPFLSGSGVSSNIERMYQATSEAVASWPKNEVFSLLPRVHRLSLEIMVRVIFGGDAPSTTNLVDRYLNFTERAVQSPLLAMPFLQFDLGRLSPWGRVMRVRDETHRFFHKEVEKRRAAFDQGISDGMLTSLMALQRDNDELNDSAVFDETFLLLFAGHETTSTSMAWIVERLLSNPNVLEKVVSEIDEVLGARPIQWGDLQKLKYLDATINEGLRMGRRAPFTGLRRVKRSFTLGKFTIPPGATIAIGHYPLCHREDLFPAPFRFEPDRFLRNEAQGTEFNPFGRGDRACAGRVFALAELKVMLATLFQCSVLRTHAQSSKAVRHGFMFGPKGGLPVTLRKR